MPVELWGGTIEWDELANTIKHNFSFVDDIPMIDATLQVIKDKHFEDVTIPVSIFSQRNVTVQS